MFALLLDKQPWSGENIRCIEDWPDEVAISRNRWLFKRFDGPPQCSVLPERFK